MSLVDGGPRSIGAGGLTSGPLAFGLWRFTHTDPAQAQEVLEVALDEGMAWSPLAGGRLATGTGLAPGLMAAIDLLVDRESAEHPAIDRSAIAIAFVLAHPSRPVAIVGSQQVDRLRALRAALDVRLDRQDCYDLIQASEGVSLP